MPKLIDHAARQDELAEATWRVILREGISAVSIRTVAAEAGVSTGSLRHVFPSKVELLVYTMQLVDRRAAARIETHLAEPDARQLVLGVIDELLPLDVQRRAEMEVNVALIAAAATDGRIQAVRDQAYRTLQDACRRMIVHLVSSRVIDADIDLDDEAAALHALIDGLATHMLISDDCDFGQRARRIVAAYLFRPR